MNLRILVVSSFALLMLLGCSGEDEAQEDPGAVSTAANRVIESCRDLLPNMELEQVAIREDGQHRGVSFLHFKPPDQSIELVLRSDGDLEGCDDFYLDIVLGARGADNLFEGFCMLAGDPDNAGLFSPTAMEYLRAECPDASSVGEQRPQF